QCFRCPRASSERTDEEMMRDPSELGDGRMETHELARPAPLSPASVPRYGFTYDYDGDAEQQGGYSRLHEYWVSARKHLWLIFGIMLLVTALAALYVARQPDVYESTARLQVDLEVNNPALGSIK